MRCFAAGQMRSRQDVSAEGGIVRDCDTLRSFGIGENGLTLRDFWRPERLAAAINADEKFVAVPLHDPVGFHPGQDDVRRITVRTVVCL